MEENFFYKKLKGKSKPFFQNIISQNPYWDEILPALKNEIEEDFIKPEKIISEKKNNLRKLLLKENKQTNLSLKKEIIIELKQFSRYMLEEFIRNGWAISPDSEIYWILDDTTELVLKFFNGEFIVQFSLR